MSRPAAGDRVRRLLSVIPWVASHPEGVAIDEVCARFQMTRSQLVADLGDLAMMVGPFPRTPDTLIEAWVDDGWVQVVYPRAFDRALRLTPNQATQLVAAGVGLQSVPGSADDGPLARALAKLAEALGFAPGTNVAVDVGQVSPDVLSTLDHARTAREQIEIDYFSYNRDERTTRVVDPFALFADRGAWYLQGYCHLSEDQRVFRLDRIEDIRLTGSRFELPDDIEEPIRFQAAPDDPRVRLRLAPSAAWVIESYPTESVDRGEDGRIEAVLAISQPSWLSRLLLRLGPDVEVVDAPEELRQVGRTAAARVLERYR